MAIWAYWIFFSETPENLLCIACVSSVISHLRTRQDENNAFIQESTHCLRMYSKPCWCVTSWEKARFLCFSPVNKPEGIMGLVAIDSIRSIPKIADWLFVHTMPHFSLWWHSQCHVSCMKYIRRNDILCPPSCTIWWNLIPVSCQFRGSRNSNRFMRENILRSFLSS